MQELIEKYRSKGLLIDTNLLVVFFVGKYSEALIQEFKRTKDKYTISDYLLLTRIMTRFKQIVFTQSILTEVSNLLNQLSEATKAGCYGIFEKSMERMVEEYIPSKDIVTLPGFTKYGLADTGILAHTKGKYLVLTDDLRFAGFLDKNKVDVINFNHIRFMDWKR